jgi:hypothetical protein
MEIFDGLNTKGLSRWRFVDVCLSISSLGAVSKALGWVLEKKPPTIESRMSKPFSTTRSRYKLISSKDRPKLRLATADLRSPSDGDEISMEFGIIESMVRNSKPDSSQQIEENQLSTYMASGVPVKLDFTLERTTKIALNATKALKGIDSARQSFKFRLPSLKKGVNSQKQDSRILAVVRVQAIWRGYSVRRKLRLSAAVHRLFDEYFEPSMRDSPNITFL